MPEERWDISEKDAEFFARLMGVSRPSDARPWHAQFPDISWLVTLSTDNTPAEAPPSDTFPDLELLEAPVDESPPKHFPSLDSHGGVDLDWLTFQRQNEEPLGPFAGDETEESAPPEMEEPEEVDAWVEAAAVPPEEPAKGDETFGEALGEILASLAGASELRPSEKGEPQPEASAKEGEEDRPEEDTADSPASETCSRDALDLIGAGELSDEDGAQLCEELVIPTADEGEHEDEVSLPEEGFFGSDEANLSELEDLDLGELIGASEVGGPGEEGTADSEAGATAGAQTVEPEAGSEALTLPGEEPIQDAVPHTQPEDATPDPDSAQEAEPGEATGERSALVPDEWTELRLDEAGHPGSEAVVAELGAEEEQPPELEAEEVIGAAELSERAAVPWKDDSAVQESSEGDAFVELAVEQRIRRPGLFHRLALVDTDRRVGIEIGKHQVIYTIVVKRRNRFELEGYGIIPVEAQNGDNEAAEKVGLQKVLEEIFSDRTLRQAYVAVADDEMETLIRRLELPRLSRKEMSEALHWALRKELPFDPDAAQIAHMYLTDRAEKNSRKVPVLAVAASKPEVEAAVQRLRLSGVRIGSLVAPSWALYRLFTRFAGGDPETCQVLVHIGALRSEILFVQNGDLLFQRTITTALDDFVNALTSTLFEEGKRASLSRREAFALLRRYGIPEMGATGRTDTGLRLTEVAVSVRPVVEKLTNEVERSLDYFRQKFKTRQFGRLWISGIGATVLNLGGVLESGARVPTEVFRPTSDWPSFHVGSSLPTEVLEKHGPALVIPLGLATQKHEPLNLLPSRYRQSPLLRLAQRGVAYGTLAGLVTAGMVTANLAYRTQVARSDIVLLEQKHLALVKQQAELRKLENERNDLRRQLASYLAVLPKGESVSVYLKALSRLTPPSIALTSVELVPPEETAKNPNVGATEGTPTAVLRIQGIVFPDPPREGAHLAQFLLGLKQSGLFRCVRLESSRQSDLPRVGIEFLAVGELL